MSICLAAWYFGHAFGGYQHARQSLALLGATGMPGWRIANLLLFVLPGVLVAVVAWTLRSGLPAGEAWSLRMALQLGLLAALGYALQGVLNLDPTRLPDDGANRWHAVMWLLWWLAFAVSALLLAVSRGVSAGLRIASLMVAAGIALAIAGALPWPTALLYRIAIALWLGWWVALTLALSRGEASSPESSATTRT